MKVGDKVMYIGDPLFLDKDKIYTIYYIYNDYICINKISTNISLPLWESNDFISIKEYRKIKLKKIWKKKTMI